MLTGEASEFLSKDKFVSVLRQQHKPHDISIETTYPPKQMQCCLCGCEQRAGETLTTDFLFPTQDEKGAYDYQLSADRKYVAFMSNYSKVR